MFISDYLLFHLTSFTHVIKTKNGMQVRRKSKAKKLTVHKQSRGWKLFGWSIWWMCMLHSKKTRSRIIYYGQKGRNTDNKSSIMHYTTYIDSCCCWLSVRFSLHSPFRFLFYLLCMGKASSHNVENPLPYLSSHISLRLSPCSILSRQRTDSWCTMAAAHYTNLNQFAATMQSSCQFVSHCISTQQELWGKEYLLTYISTEPSTMKL